MTALLQVLLELTLRDLMYICRTYSLVGSKSNLSAIPGLICVFSWLMTCLPRRLQGARYRHHNSGLRNSPELWLVKTVGAGLLLAAPHSPSAGAAGREGDWERSVMSLLLPVKRNTGERVRGKRVRGNVTPCLKPVSPDIATSELWVN